MRVEWVICPVLPYLNRSSITHLPTTPSLNCRLRVGWINFMLARITNFYIVDFIFVSKYIRACKDAYNTSSGGSRNFVQDVLISFWKNFRSFRSILGVSGRFDKYRQKFKIWPVWSLCLKKKMFLNQNKFAFCTLKNLKRKKKVKRKEINKGTCTINYKFIWNINKIINYYCLAVSLICLSFINYNLLYCCFINYKIINFCLA